MVVAASQFLLLVATTTVNAFSSPLSSMRAFRGGAVMMADDPFSHPGWPKLEAQLNALPVFTVANERGQPLQYEIADVPTGIFYADVEAAKAELQDALKQYPDLGCDLIPVGLGNAYKLQCEKKAIIVPGKRELVIAGAPEDANPMGQTLPLFACMEIMREDEGQPVLPLFMSHGDCSTAVSEATDADGDDGDEPLEIVGLSLPSVVERLLSLADGEQSGPAFTFIAPSASAEFISEYLGTQAM